MYLGGQNRWRGSWILPSCTSVVYGIVGGVFADHLNIEIQIAYVALYNIFKKEIPIRRSNQNSELDQMTYFKETIWSTNYLKCFEITFLAILFHSVK